MAVLVSFIIAIILMVIQHLTACHTVQAGVGVFFQQESDGNVYVKTIVSGGAAERDGLIQIGDIIVAVDDREVIILSPKLCLCPAPRACIENSSIDDVL